MKVNRYAAIVLAAGFSNRMHFFKPLLPLGNQTMVDYLMTKFLWNGVDVFLVAGYHQDQLRAGIRTDGISIVENTSYRQGMFTSIQAGIRALKNEYRGAFVMPVDIPLVNPETIQILLKTTEENPGKVIHPTFQRDRGHPPLIPRELFPVVTGYAAGSNLKSVFHLYRDLELEVEVPDNNILFDIDEPIDYQELLERFHKTTFRKS